MLLCLNREVTMFLNIAFLWAEVLFSFITDFLCFMVLILLPD